MDAVVLALRVLLSLGVVLALLWVLHRKVSKLNGGQAGAGLVSVVARQGISAKASFVVVDAEGTRFYLGVTEQSVNVLHAVTTPGVSPSGSAAPDAGRPAPAGAETFAASLRLAAVDTQDPIATPDAQSHVGKTAVCDDAGAGSGRRAARTAAADLPALHGSILSPSTWKQTASVLRQGRTG